MEYPSVPGEVVDERHIVVESQAQLGLVCELTLRVNRHSNGQESPLCDHYVF